MMHLASKSGISSYLSLVFRIVLGVMFFYAGTVHALDPQSFATAVANYRILPVVLLNPFAVVLPWLELISGLALIIGIWIPGGTLIVAGLLFLFSIALGMALHRGLDISCGCFTTSHEARSISWSYLVRDISLLVLAIFVFFFDSGLASVMRITNSKK